MFHERIWQDDCIYFVGIITDSTESNSANYDRLRYAKWAQCKPDLFIPQDIPKTERTYPLPYNAYRIRIETFLN